MLSEARIAFYHMSLPQNRRKILRSASDCCHGKGLLLLIVGIVEVVLALSEIYDLHFIVGHEEKIGWFDVAVADAFALQEGTSRDEAAVHSYEL